MQENDVVRAGGRAEGRGVRGYGGTSVYVPARARVCVPTKGGGGAGMGLRDEEKLCTPCVIVLHVDSEGYKEKRRKEKRNLRCVCNHGYLIQKKCCVACARVELTACCVWGKTDICMK